MYKINTAPSKIAAKTRGGLAHSLDKFDGIKESSKKNGSIDLNTTTEHNNIPRPVFKKRISKRTKPSKKNENGVISSQNEELVNYINDSWNMLVGPNPTDATTTADQAIGSEESTLANTLAATSSLATVWIEPPSPDLEDFKPFDLESWWSRRLFENITKDL
ncbi:GL23217 [Drosophila persimilis]|uniref:GL23217 n=1 Tax=Drosophila persimilis TaxID=7234 RepID=B4G591_DROPE|nr:uncharacterized protein LOC6588061 [Drosophila persimilis]EDW24757.1 GL23217 [Drosophila persimilis]